MYSRQPFTLMWSGKKLTHVLLISDSEALASTLLEQMSPGADFRLEWMSTVDIKSASNAAGAIPDILVTGILHSSQEAVVINRSLRHLGWDLPMIIIADRGFEADVGASIVMQAPFRCSQFLKMINSALVSVATERDMLWMISGCKYYPGEKQLVNGANAIFRLTEKEAAILARLYKADGESVSREELLRDLWGYHAEAETHTVETHIYRLRQKLEPDPAQASILVTDTNGYRLNLDL